MVQVSLAAGLEESGAIGRGEAKRRAQEAMTNLQEAARILQVTITEQPDFPMINKSNL